MQSSQSPFAEIPPPKRRPILGSLVWLAGWVVFPGSAAILAYVPAYLLEFYWFNPVEDLDGPVELHPVTIAAMFVGIFASVPLAPFGMRLLRTGRRMWARRGFDRLARDGRRTVLLLRSFDEDDLFDPTIGSLSLLLHTYEDRIARALRRLGPVVAIGEPGEAEPESGATRVYVEYEDWKTAVEYFLDHSAAVVIQVGRSEGLRWEIETSLSRVEPQRLLFFFPRPTPKEFRGSWRYWMVLRSILSRWFARDEQSEMEAARQQKYELFRHRFGDLLQGRLPESLGESSFLDFDSDWNPRLLPRAKAPTAIRIITILQDTSADLHIKRELKPFVAKLTENAKQ